MVGNGGGMGGKEVRESSVTEDGDVGYTVEAHETMRYPCEEGRIHKSMLYDQVPHALMLTLQTNECYVCTIPISIQFPMPQERQKS